MNIIVTVNIRAQEDPRTNNELQGWHTRFCTSFLHCHIHIWKFIDKLKQDSSLKHLKMAHGIVGALNAPQRWIYWETTERLRTPVDEYGRNNLIDVLRGILTTSRNKHSEY